MNRMQGLAIAALCWLALPASQAQAQSFDSVARHPPHAHAGHGLPGEHGDVR